jgi:hypothetical protein
VEVRPAVEVEPSKWAFFSKTSRKVTRSPVCKVRMRGVWGKHTARTKWIGRKTAIDNTCKYLLCVAGFRERQARRIWAILPTYRHLYTAGRDLVV